MQSTFIQSTCNSVCKVCGSKSPAAGGHPSDPLVVDAGQQAEGLDVQPGLWNINRSSSFSIPITTSDI